jgi:hypothetical protein
MGPFKKKVKRVYVEVNKHNPAVEINTFSTVSELQRS